MAFGTAPVGTAAFGTSGSVEEVVRIAARSAVAVETRASVIPLGAPVAEVPARVDVSQGLDAQGTSARVPVDSTYRVPVQVTDDGEPVDLRGGAIEYRLVPEGGTGEPIVADGTAGRVRRSNPEDGAVVVTFSRADTPDAGAAQETLRLSFGGDQSAIQFSRRVRFTDEFVDEVTDA